MEHKVNYRVCNYPPPVPILSQISPVHLHLVLPSGLFPSGFPTKTLHVPLLSPIRATCLAHLILLDLITRTILDEKYRSFIFSLCSFLCSPVTSPPAGQIFSSTPSSQTLSAYVHPSIWAIKFHTNTKQQAKLYFCISLNFWIANWKTTKFCTAW